MSWLWIYTNFNWHFQYTAYADVDTYVNTYADLKYRGRVSIFSIG